MPDRLPFRSVTSRQNRIVSAFREAAAHPSGERVLIESARLALEAAQAGWTLEVVAIAGEKRESAAAAALMAELDDRTDLIAVTSPVLDAMSPAASPSGIVALARPPNEPRDWIRGPVPLVIVACDVQDPGNVGAIVRAAEAAGCSGLLVCGTSAHPFGWKALRGSMGSAFRLPIATHAAPADAVRAVRSRGLAVIALTAREGKDLYDGDLRVPCAMVVGGEGSGLPAEVLAAADRTISIPMAPPVESLNVAVSAAVALYEARRQRSLTADPDR